MPKYRFTTDDGEDLSVSDSHLVLADDKAASDEAQKALANIAREKLPDGSKTEYRVAVENEADEVAYQASLKFRGETGEEMAEHRKFNFSGVHKSGEPRRDGG